MSGHACPKCEGIGTVRLRGKPGYVRIPCDRCGGSGQLRPSPYVHATDCPFRGDWRLALSA